MSWSSRSARKGCCFAARGTGAYPWEDTFKDMAREREDWSDLDAALNDGLDTEPW